MKRPALRVTIQIAAILILVAVTALVMGPVRSELERRITHLKIQAIEQIEATIGRRISYSSISPSILRYLAINDLTVHGLSDEPADLITVQRLKIYYRPLDLIRGELTEAVSEIRIENTTLSVDTRRDSDLVAILADIAGSREAQGAASLIPNDLTLSGRNIELKIASELGIVRVENLFFTSTASNDVLSVRTQGDLQILATSTSFGISEIEGRLLASGTYDLNSGNALFDVTVPRLRSDVASMERQVFQVSYDTQIVEARKVQDRNPIDLYLRFQPEPMELYARILSDGYRLSDLVRLEGEFSEYNAYINSPVRGQATAIVTEHGVTYAGSILTHVSGLPIPDGDLTVQFSGDTERVTIDHLDYRSEIGDIEYDGSVQFQPFRPDGRVSLRNFVYGGIAPLSVTGRVESSGDTIRLNTNRFTYAGVHLSKVSGFLSLGEFPFAEATVTIGGSQERRLDIATEHDASGELRRLTVDARSVLPTELERLQLAILPDLELPDLDFLPDSLLVDTRLSADFIDTLSVDVPLFYAVDMAQPDNRVSFSLRYSDEKVEVRDVTVSYDGYDGTGNFVAEFGRGGAIAFESDVVVEGIPYQFAGIYDPAGSFVISGLHDVDARFYFGARDELVFSGSGNIPLPISEGVESRLAFDGEGYIFSETDWAVTVNHLSATGVPYYAVEGADFRLAGKFDPAGGVLSEFGYSDAFSALSGSGSVNWDLPEPAGSLDLVLTDELGEETYAGSVDYDGEILSISAVFTRLPLLRAGISTVRGSLSGAIEMNGPLDSLHTKLAATLQNGRFNGDLVEITGVVNVNPTVISVDGLSGRYVRTRFEGIAGELSLENGTASLAGSVVQPNDTGEVEVGFTLLGEFGDSRTSFTEMLATDFAARVVVTGLPVQDDLPEDWQFALNRVAGTLSIVGGPEDALVGILEEDGEFSLSLAAPVPLSFEAVGNLRNGSLEADLINVSADVARLWRIVDSPGVTFLSGMAEGSVRIVGPLNDPDFYGTLTATNITGTVDLVADLVGPARTFLVFDEKVLSIREAVVPAGPGRARISAAVTLDRWLPDEYRVWVDTVKGDPLRVVHDFGGVAIDGLADGSIVVSGGPDTVLIEGGVIGSAMYITLSELEETVGTGEQTGDLLVDVQVTTGRGVHFLWPTDAFPIVRGIADAGETARITHQQSTGNYTVDGSVNILGGEVFYFDRSFYIKDGRLIFAEDQSDFDPLLTVNAEIREVGQEGPIRVYLVADERPLSQFTPQWRSDPPLPEAEIMALLGGNVFAAQNGDPISLSQAVLLTSDLVSQFGIIRGFESTIRDALQLDLFSIRTQLFQNLIRGVLDQADYPLDSDLPSLGKYLDNTTLFLGKYLGTDLFLELLVQLRATDPVATPTRSLAGIAVDSELSLEWQTPFFLLEWSFFPRDPSSLFLTDNTISLGWEYLY